MTGRTTGCTTASSRAPRSPKKARDSARLEQDQRDLPVGLLLVAGVVLVLLGDDRPEASTFLGAGDSGPHRLLRPALVGDLDRRVVAQIEEPCRMRRVATPRRDHDDR